ncbi:MAG: RdgB/HAM1 family non-canonical purine NTP pyrophosphatase [bacterium]
MILLLGSNNKYKASEIKQIFEETGLRPDSTSDFSVKILSDVLNEFFDVVEDGDTLEENAFKKANEYFQITNIPCFADDTGLEIDALNGSPGVKSARFAGEDCIDKNNRKKVLELLKNIPDGKRTAQFRTVICFVDSKQTKYIEGVCKGKIIYEERGTNGFGYDSIFVPVGFGKTFAEMDADEKNLISHRGNAIRKFAEFIDTLK